MKGLVVCFLVQIITQGIIALVHIDSMKLCGNEQYSIMWGVKLKDDGDKQVVEEGFMDTQIDMNDDLLNRVLIYQKEDDKWTQIVDKTDGVCKIADTFMGNFVKGLENSAGIKETCPYAKGKYFIKNYPLDFSNFKYKDFPPGQVRVRSEFFSKDQKDKLLSCYEIEFTLKK